MRLLVAPHSRTFPVTERVKVATLDVLGLNIDRDTGYPSEIFSDFIQSLHTYPGIIPLLDYSHCLLSLS